ncbi:MAG TPA: hypothetical protein VEU47_03805 [Candidatus Cybelea sp.]|nr:hypothetical protein [Candidatus Cybelea sp.]
MDPSTKTNLVNATFPITLQFENVSPFIYRDSLGVPTIGIGAARQDGGAV